MRRTTFQAPDLDREDQREEEQAERRALRKALVDDVEEDDWRFGSFNPSDPEFESLETFIEDLLDCEQLTFVPGQLACLNRRLGIPVHTLRRALEDYGFTFVGQAKQHAFRTFGTNPHDRWYGPGSCPTSGGSGASQISGFAGQEG